MRKLTLSTCAMVIALMAPAYAKKQPLPELNVILVLDNGGGPAAAEIPITAEQAGENQPHLLLTELAILAAISDLNSGKRDFKKRVVSVSIIGTFAGVLTGTTPKGILNNSLDDVLTKYTPKADDCAPLAPIFQEVNRLAQKNDEGRTVIVVVSPLIDALPEYCRGTVAKPEDFFSGGPKPEYELDKLLAMPSVDGFYFVGTHREKLPTWRPYVTKAAHDGVQPEWLTLRETINQIETKLRSH